jgi:hypothetical protein
MIKTQQNALKAVEQYGVWRKSKKRVMRGFN